MVALAPNTSETSTWDVHDTFPKLHSRAREVNTRICTEAPHSKSFGRVEIWQVVFESCDGLESFTREPIGYLYGANLVRYARNNPSKYVDPTGLFDEVPDPTSDPIWGTELPDKNECCKCDKIVEEIKKKAYPISVPGPGNSTCNVLFICKKDCPGGAPGFTPKPKTTGVNSNGKSPPKSITICLSSKMTTCRDYRLTVLHELQHAKDFCMDPNIDMSDCDVCKTFESKAHTINCTLLYPDDADAREKCIACGVHYSCKESCNYTDDDKPEGCPASLGLNFPL